MIKYAIAFFGNNQLSHYTGVSQMQCRRQSNRSEATLAESAGALKQTKFLHIKTDILRLQIMRYFINFAFISEKKTCKAGSIF